MPCEYSPNDANPLPPTLQFNKPRAKSVLVVLSLHFAIVAHISPQQFIPDQIDKPITTGVPTGVHCSKWRKAARNRVINIIIGTQVHGSDMLMLDLFATGDHSSHIKPIRSHLSEYVHVALAGSSNIP